MTVKEAIKVLKKTKQIIIGFGDRAIPIEQDDELMVDVYGDYVIDTITFVDSGECELNVAMCPVKMGAE